MTVFLSIYINANFLQAHAPSVEDGKKIVEKIIEIFEKEGGINDGAKELGLDLDTDDFEAVDSEEEEDLDEGEVM